LRHALAAAARVLEATGLNHGRAGNVSVRVDGGMLITPTAVCAQELDAAAMVAMGLDGTTRAGAGRPSSEWRFHAAVYTARPDLAALVHAHPPYATALACARKSIPAFHYTVALAGTAHIGCADYATFGTPELAHAVVVALGAAGRACLMANHGLLAASGDLDGALALAQEVEYLARVYWLTLQAGGPVILDDAEMERVLARMVDYHRR